MDKQFFKTVIKGTHKHGQNLYVIGRLSGIGYVICGHLKSFGCGINRNGEHKDSCFIHECSPEQYEKFKELVEKEYPGLCIFNYKRGSK